MDSLFSAPLYPPSRDDLPENNFSLLLDAISERSYPLIYARLRRYDYTFSPEAAFQLLDKALESRLTLKAFQAILERCPPAPEVLSSGPAPDMILRSCSLTDKAAYLDRADVLELLLEWGAGPNQQPDCDYSPLEAALAGQSLECVKLLVERPELDTAWTPQLLCEWAHADHGLTLLDFCLQTMAPRFTGWEAASLQPLPIPEPMTARLIVEAGNWPLLERFCRERGTIPPDDGRQALNAIQPLEVQEWNEQACAAALNALLERCPGLLRGQMACRTLLRCFLRFDGEARELLRPWAESLRRRRISMEREDWIDLEYDGFLNRWLSLLPRGPVLVIDRWSDALEDPLAYDGMGGEAVLLRSEAIRRILSLCPVRGKGRTGKVSPVAQAALRYGTPELLAEQFRPGGLLAEEDPDALLNYAQDSECPRMNRNAVLAYVRKEENYEL